MIMEDRYNFLIVKSLLFVLLAFLNTLSAQSGYEMSLANGALINSTTFEFDVYIRSTDGDFTLTSYQCSLTYNENIITGSHLYFSYVDGTTELSLMPQFAIGCNCNDITEKLTFASGAGIETITTEYKMVGKFRLETDSPFANETPDICWCFDGNVVTMMTDNSWNNIATLSQHLDLEYSDPLPVELFSFYGSVIDNNIILSWKTATETNNFGFEVERSINNATLNWEKIGFVRGYGNSNTPKSYEFVDENPFGGNSFKYRLKQIDINGDIEYSNIVDIDYSPLGFELFQNYPNPFNPNTKIKFSMLNDAKVNLTVYNILGEKVTELINSYMTAGLHVLEFNAGTLASGTYIYKLDVENQFTDIKKMLLIK